MTGASGAQYGLRLLECLLAAECRVYFLISAAARVVLACNGYLRHLAPDVERRVMPTTR